MNANEAKKKNLLLPHYIIGITKFLVGYQALRLYDRIKIVRRLLLRWLAVFYAPIYIWLIANVVKYFWGWSGGPASSVLPFFLGWIPLPLLQPIGGNFFEWVLCILIDIGWLIVGSIMLNIVIERGINFERIEEKWRRACLQTGLTTATNMEPENDVKEYPPVVSITPEFFIVESKGITPEQIQEKRVELSGAMAIFLGDINFAKKLDGSQYANLIEVGYSWNDLPAMVPLRNVEVAEPGSIILGKGMRGWHKLSLADAVHIGVSGEIGSGKSVFLRSILTQILVTNPNAIIIGIDFKGGSEFAVFESSPNFMLVDEYDNAGKALRSVLAEYRRRVELVRASEADSIYQLRDGNGLPIPPIIVVLDEAAEFFQKMIPQDVLNCVDRLARLGRFAAIHLIIATQRASADVIPTQIRSMLTTRVVFKMSQREDSIMSIGTAAATKLRRVPGRFYLLTSEGNLREIQGPYVDKGEVKQILSRLSAPAPNELVNALKKNAWQMRLAA